MSAHVKKVEQALPSVIIADDEWQRHLNKPGLRVVDAYGTDTLTS